MRSAVMFADISCQNEIEEVLTTIITLQTECGVCTMVTYAMLIANR